MPTRMRSRRPTSRTPRAIRSLVDMGLVDRLLLSQDVFLKIMLTRYGGFGYGYILKHFIPRLARHGVDRAIVDRMLIDNPRTFFRKATV